MDQIDAALADDAAFAEKIVSDTVQWQGKIFSAHTLDVSLPDGSLGYREIVRHHGGAGAVAVADGKICLVRQYRVALGRMTLEIPAGKLEGDEPGWVCAERELLEETGLRAERFELIASSMGSVGFTDEHTDIYLAQGLSRGEAAPDEGEFVQVLWLPVEEALSAVRTGRICDAKTVIAVLAVAGGLV